MSPARMPRLRAVLLPNLRGALALKDQGELLIQVVLHLEGFARRDLANEHPSLGLKGPGQLHERRQTLGRALPGLARKLGQIIYAGDCEMDRDLF